MKRLGTFITYLLLLFYFAGTVVVGLAAFNRYMSHQQAGSYANDPFALAPLEYFALAVLFIGLVVVTMQLSRAQEGSQLVIQQVTESQSKADHHNKMESMDDFKKLEQSILNQLDHILLDHKSGQVQKVNKALSLLCNELNIGQGMLYKADYNSNRSLRMISSYAVVKPDSEKVEFEFGEGLPGQCAKEQKLINLHEVAAATSKISSGLGAAIPRHLILSPVVHQHKTLGVIELGSFTPFHSEHEKLLKEVSLKLSETLENAEQP
jgi:putative methionine-R-sulfoxide reductase with GAF domain